MEDFVVVGEGASADDAATLAASHRPDVLLLDVSMPGGGIEAISEIVVGSPQTKVLMLTASEDVDPLIASLRRGAAGYVVKGIGSRGLADAIRTVVGGSRYISPSMRAKLEKTLLDRPAYLTPRETEVMELVAEGLTNKYIARRLDLQEKTIKHHMTEILFKLAASNRTEAAIKWRQGS
ncbi:chemotaxis protein CheY (plasmid) [Rhizobium leguminosarum bv. trifolii WSM1689]|nr:chemotaxis protein CheY [Rhizobium leguminosarum bv. trifolii WSM1689]